MSKVSPTSLVFWYAGYDFAGLGAITEVKDSLVARVQDVTPLGPMGVLQHEEPLGTCGYTLTESGFARDRQTSLRRLFFDNAVATPWPVILGKEGGAIGSSCRIATDMRIKDREMPPAIDGFTKLNYESYLAKGGTVKAHGLLLATGAVSGVDIPGAATPNTEYRLDLGAASNIGATICLMADVEASRWRGWPTLTLQVRHSMDGSPGTWANLGTSMVLTRNGKGAKIVTIPVGTTIRRYVALRWTFSGSRDAFSLQGNYAAGDTAITVDGSTGTERIEKGDTLIIDGASYIVDDVAAGLPGEWNVTLAVGLEANAADNDAVTMGGTPSLRYAGAIDRGESSALDTTAPLFVNAVVNGSTLTMNYNEMLDIASIPAAGDFAVIVAGAARTVSLVAISGENVELTLASAVAHGEAVTVAYTPGTNPVQDAAGNDVLALTATAVTNQTPVPDAMNFLALSDDALIATSEFAVSDTDRTLSIPAYVGTKYIAFAIPATQPDVTAVYLYNPAHPNTVNQSSAFGKQAGTVLLNGVAHKWWLSRSALSGYGGYVLELVN